MQLYGQFVRSSSFIYLPLPFVCRIPLKRDYVREKQLTKVEFLRVSSHPLSHSPGNTLTRTKMGEQEPKDQQQTADTPTEKKEDKVPVKKKVTCMSLHLYVLKCMYACSCLYVDMSNESVCIWARVSE